MLESVIAIYSSYLRGVEIGMHSYVGSKATWDVIPEGVIQFQEGPPKT
ncbi:hypothetical protein Lepto7375DRAFT_8241 [Leptolyngbya sp. PCC 7375]|nr:hypothetical protein Lepto7375DRAFT_8241 [Leptolyngbya sp. PCC 7375]